MSADRTLADLLDTATTDVPAAVATPPLAAIHRRVRRRRGLAGGASALAVLVFVAGGFTFGHRMLVDPPDRVTPIVSPSVAAVPGLSWTSAFVARDDLTVTVYAGAARCAQLNHPRARVVAQDATEVVISVTATTTPADDCATSGTAVGVPLTLASPLGNRALTGPGGPHPVYRERYLPDLRSTATWSPVDSVSWEHDDVDWYQSYNGPGGTELNLRAQPRSAPLRPAVGTMKAGPYPGTISGSARTTWRVCWPGGDATYCAELVPAEGGSTTLSSFKQQIAALWP